MGSFVDWFSRSYKGVIIGLVAFGTIMLVVLALQHVDASRPAAGAEPGPIPTFTSSAAPFVTFMGDSYTQGSQENSGPRTVYPFLIRQDLKIGYQNIAIGGSGYVNPGQSGAPFSGQVREVSSQSALVVVYGSRNDPVDSNPAEVKKAASDLYTAIKAKAPQAKLVVIGPSFVENPTPAGGTSNANAIRDAADDAGATYVDASDWFHGTPANYIGEDHIHPTDAGHKYLASKIEPIVEDALK
jgi:lysophospholipase L1-like esterase